MHSYVILPATLCCSMQHHGPVSPNLLTLTLHNPKLARHWSRFRFLFDPENFLVREPELFTGQRAGAQEGEVGGGTMLGVLVDHANLKPFCGRFMA